MVSAATLPLRLVTFNVRFATDNPSPGEQPWSVRCPKLCTQLNFITTGHSSAFICLQEVLYSQLLDIQAQLGASWAYIGKGRDDGARAGEFSPIFYRSDAWRCERNETYWLSETPEKPSFGWDADCKRVVTIGRFCQLETGARVVVMDTHLDHRGEKARQESVKLLLNLASSWQESSDSTSILPLFLGGDFNSTPDGAAYKDITTSDNGMTDISNLIPSDKRYGNPDQTYTSFGEPNETPGCIDFLFARQTGGVTFLTFGILPNKFDDSIYLSDHRPVVADVEISL